MTAVGLFDTLTIDARPIRAGDVAAAGAILRLSSDVPGLPCDATNLVVRAADAFALALRGAACESGDELARNAGDGAAGVVDGERESVVAADDPFGRDRARADGEVTRVRPVDATLAKRIPLGAGLGGGSSDAARMLEGLNVLWRAGWTVERLSQLAATLGSDVPFFLHTPSSVCTGRGEHVRPVPPPAMARWAVLVLPDIQLPTADVYRRFDALDLGYDDALARPPDWAEWAALPADELMPRLVNDLEQPAFEIRPELGALRERIESSLPRPVRMSGSGSSLFMLCDKQAEAEEWAEMIVSRSDVPAAAVELCPAIADDLNGSFARA